MPEPEELPRSKSPLKILREEDVAEMLEHGLTEPMQEDAARVAKESFLNRSKAKENAKDAWEDAKRHGDFLTTITGDIYIAGYDPVVGDDLELNAESLEHENVHKVLQKMKKLKASLALDHFVPNALTLPKYGEGFEASIELEFLQSQKRLDDAPAFSLETAFKKYKREGSY